MNQKRKIRTEIPPPEVNEIDPMPKEAVRNEKQGKCNEKTEPENESISLRERFNIFMNETSFTALTRIHKANSIVKRLIWFIVLLAMLVWLGLQCYWLLEKYLGYPVDVKIELKSQPTIDFPSVTICNRNPLKKSKIASSPYRDLMAEFLTVKQDERLYDKALDLFMDYDDYSWEEEEDNSTSVWGSSTATSATQNTHTTTPSVTGTTHTAQQNTSSSLLERMKRREFNIWDALSDETTADMFYKTKDSECSNMLAYSAFAASIDHDELESYGHDIKDLLMGCKFNGYPCSVKNFTYIHNAKYGNCYTYNHHQNNQSSVFSNYPGPLMGLVMEFNIEQDEYVEALASDAGVRVMIHERGTYPFPDDDGFSIAPGFVTSVGIKEVRISRLPPPHADCANQGLKTDYYRQAYGTSYRKMPCLKSCYQDAIIENCKCAVPYYIMKKEFDVCDTSNETILECLMEVSSHADECDRFCPNPCSEKKYEAFLSMGNWPSSAYAFTLEKRMMKSSTDFMDDEGKGKISSNLAKLEVFYRELIYENIEQQKAYESQNLISDIGGQLGLWLGLSAITIGELVEFFAAIFKAVTAKAVRRKNYDSEPARAFKTVAMRAVRRPNGVSDGTRIESLAE